jgi:hypothetical protein
MNMPGVNIKKLAFLYSFLPRSAQRLEGGEQRVSEPTWVQQFQEQVEEKSHAAKSIHH